MIAIEHLTICISAKIISAYFVIPQFRYSIFHVLLTPLQIYDYWKWCHTPVWFPYLHGILSFLAIDGVLEILRERIRACEQSLSPSYALFNYLSIRIRLERQTPTSYPDYTIHLSTHAYTLSPNGVVPPQRLATDNDFVTIHRSKNTSPYTTLLS